MSSRPKKSTQFISALYTHFLIWLSLTSRGLVSSLQLAFPDSQTLYMYFWFAPPVSNFLPQNISLRGRRELTVANCGDILRHENFKLCGMIIGDLVIRGRWVFGFRSYIIKGVSRRMRWVWIPCEVSKSCYLLTHSTLHLCVHIVFDSSKVIGWLVGCRRERLLVLFFRFCLNVFGSVGHCDYYGKNNKGCHFGGWAWAWVWVSKLDTEIVAIGWGFFFAWKRRVMCPW